jgi:hypothetical protein
MRAADLYALSARIPPPHFPSVMAWDYYYQKSLQVGDSALPLSTSSPPPHDPFQGLATINYTRAFYLSKPRRNVPPRISFPLSHLSLSLSLSPSFNGQASLSERKVRRDTAFCVGSCALSKCPTLHQFCD